VYLILITVLMFANDSFKCDVYVDYRMWIYLNAKRVFFRYINCPPKMPEFLNGSAWFRNIILFVVCWIKKYGTRIHIHVFMTKLN